MSHNRLTYSSYGASEMKRLYQRNLLFANLTLIVLVLLIGVGISLYHRLNPHDSIAVSQHDIDQTVRVMTLVLQPPQPVKRHVTARKPEAPMPLGLLDNIQATPDAPEPLPLDTSLVYSTAENAAEFDTSEQSYSDLVGETGIGMFPPAYLPDTTPDEPADVVCSVLVAVPPEYPWVAREQHKEGAAGIIVCIDEDGKVTLFSEEIAEAFRAKDLAVRKMSVRVNGNRHQFNYVVTYEEPSGFFFAEKVAEVLPRWVFAPSIVDGQPTRTLLPIGHAFCLSKDCAHQYGVLRNYKSYHPVASR